MVFLTCENALEIVLGNEDPPPANASFAMRESYKKRLGLATGTVYSSVEPSIRGLHLERSSTRPHPALVAIRSQNG